MQVVLDVGMANEIGQVAGTAILRQEGERG